jgi:hypothetical protein
VASKRRISNGNILASNGVTHRRIGGSGNSGWRRRVAWFAVAATRSVRRPARGGIDVKTTLPRRRFVSSRGIAGCNTAANSSIELAAALATRTASCGNLRNICRRNVLRVAAAASSSCWAIYRDAC